MWFSFTWLVFEDQQNTKFQDHVTPLDDSSKDNLGHPKLFLFIVLEYFLGTNM